VDIESESRFARALGVARQASIITGSILLALALESFWGGLMDRRAEAQALTALRTEFLETRVEVLRARGVHGERCDAATALRGMFQVPEADVDVDALAVLTKEMASITSVNAPNGVLTGMISSGRLSLIRDDDLRAALAGWPQRLADHRESEDYVLAVIREQWVPWLTENTVLTDTWGRPGAVAESSYDRALLARVLGDQQFRNLVMGHDYTCTFVLRDSENLERDVDAILEALVARRR